MAIVVIYQQQFPDLESLPKRSKGHLVKTKVKALNSQNLFMGQRLTFFTLVTSFFICLIVIQIIWISYWKICFKVNKWIIMNVCLHTITALSLECIDYQLFEDSRKTSASWEDLITDRYGARVLWGRFIIDCVCMQMLFPRIILFLLSVTLQQLHP